MKKLIIAISCMLAFTAGSLQAKDWKEVRIAVDVPYEPFEYKASDGTLTGFEIDLGNAVCAEIGAKCEWIPQAWDGIIPGLLARKYDAIMSSMSITEERKKKVDFTGKYALIPNKFIAKKGANLDFDNLDGQKIAVQRATTHDKYLTDNYGDKVEIVRYGSFDEAYLDLANGRVVAVLGDASALEEGVLNKEGGEGYEFVGPSLTDPKWFGDGFGIAVRKQDKDLTEKLDAAILSLRDKGVYQEIAARYFNYDVYGE